REPPRRPARGLDGRHVGRLLGADRAADEALLAVPDLGARARARLDPARRHRLPAGGQPALVALAQRLASVRVRRRGAALSDEHPLVQRDREGRAGAGVAGRQSAAVLRRALRPPAPVGAPRRRRDRGRRPDLPRDRARAACARHGGGRGTGGPMTGRLRQRLAQQPPGYRFTIGRILAIYAGIMVALLLAALDQTIVATALPRIVSDLGGLSSYSWVFTAYMLATTVTVPLYGKLGDKYGRRPLFLFAISLFLLGSALCGLA